MAFLAAAFTLPLLFVGGSVTTYRVGLAVPDWPTTFGVNMFLYNFWYAPFGVQVEHTHRLYGAAVGLATVGLMFWLLIFDPRRWIKGLGVVALVTVIVQGVLGGTRVTQVSTVLAAVHGCMGQTFFALMVALCVFTGRDWLGNAPPAEDVQHFRRRSVTMLVLVYLQVIFGAWFRHFGDLAALGLHLFTGLAVIGHALALVVRIGRNRDRVPFLVPSGVALGLLTTVQVALGIVALVVQLPLDGVPRVVGFYEAVARTGHQTNAALLLASSVVLTLRSFRHLRSSAGPEAAKEPRSQAAGGPGTPASLEVVA
jgi:cytochrome c oxidase assembly protein subunit 15